MLKPILTYHLMIFSISSGFSDIADSDPTFLIKTVSSGTWTWALSWKMQKPHTAKQAKDYAEQWKHDLPYVVGALKLNVRQNSSPLFVR